MNVAFRVDASSHIGTGHVVRCLSLADGLASAGARVRFVCRHLTEGLDALIRQKGYELVRLAPSPGAADELAHAHWLQTSQAEDARQTAAALAGTGWDWLVVDHYALDSRWQSALRGVAHKLMVIDDLADRRHDCDLLLDQNFYVDMDRRYAGLVPDRCDLLLGPAFVLLRDEFRHVRAGVAPRSGEVRRILVFLGGIDGANHTGGAIAALAGLAPRPAVDVVIGEAHPARAEIVAACAAHGFTCHVQARNMAELIAAADLAVGAGGTATWERCCLGLPALTLSVADNQRRVTQDCALAGLIYAPGMQGNAVAWMRRHLLALIENEPLRTLISSNGLAMVDGKGTSRLVRRLTGGAVRIRPATWEDSDDLLAWRNHPTIRAVSRSADPIAAEDHRRWLAGVLRDSQRVLLIGDFEGTPAGVVRFDIADGAAEVSIYRVPGQQGGRLGPALLGEAEHWLLRHRSDVRSLKAVVLGDNAASHRLFADCGFGRESTLYRKTFDV